VVNATLVAACLILLVRAYKNMLKRLLGPKDLRQGHYLRASQKSCL